MMISVARIAGVIGLLAGFLAFTPPSPAQAAGVVGTGNADSCTEAALDAALSGGGLVTFNCGGPATIGLTSEKIIAANTSINGGGLITLDGRGQTRLISVDNGVQVELTGLTLTGGNSAGALEPDWGGAIYNAGDLTITASTISGNDAGRNGGGIQNDSGTLEIIGSTVSENSADNSGGGIHTDEGTVTITDSTLSGNSAVNGGAIQNRQGDLTIMRSTLNDNRTTGTFGVGGAAIKDSRGTTTVIESTLDGNIAADKGGAIDAGTSLTVIDSTISNNQSGTFGGGIANFTFQATVTIRNSTLSGNSAGNRGGGILVDALDVSITASTLSGNTAPSGGAIYLFSSSVNFGDATLQNTVLAGNGPTDSCAVFNTGSFISQDFNLSDDATCNLNQGNDLVNTPANLAPLGDYGGPTQTHRPLTGSPAIDSANCVNSADQRGVSRPQNGDCDRGSVEVLAPVDLNVLCIDRFTGRVISPPRGQCAVSQVRIDLPSPRTLTFCISRYTGEISFSFGRPCSSNHIAHVIPGDGDLLACQSRYTGALRSIASAEGCAFDTETPVRIPEPTA